MHQCVRHRLSPCKEGLGSRGSKQHHGGQQMREGGRALPLQSQSRRTVHVRSIWLNMNPFDAESRFSLPVNDAGTRDHCYLKVPKVEAHLDCRQSNGWYIDYLLSKGTHGKRSLNCSLLTIVIILTCNIGKAAVM